MGSSPIITVLEEAQISPPPTTVGDQSLQLNFFDILWLPHPPVHHLFFYELPLTQTQFTQTIIPSIKHTLSITLQHFFPFAGKLFVFPTTARKPEIRYTEGDSVAVTFAESTLDFNDLSGNHPRECDKFYPLIPLLGPTAKVSDHVTVPVFSVQVTFFPNCGFSIGMTNHHSLADASTRFCFLKAWTTIARSGDDESFLADGTLPVFDRAISYPKWDQTLLNEVKIETFDDNYRPPRLSGPTDKVRATLVLTRNSIDRLKKFVSTQLPELEYVSSFTVACAYLWSCIAKTRNDELEVFGFPVDCRARMDPPLPAAYFGNCIVACAVVGKTADLIGKEGFANAAKLLGENLLKMLKDEEGLVKYILPMNNITFETMPTTITAVAGTTKVKFYDMDFGWGKPKKNETISLDYSGSISLNTCKESSQDLEIGVTFSAADMEVFVGIFNGGLEEYK